MRTELHVPGQDREIFGNVGFSPFANIGADTRQKELSLMSVEEGSGACQLRDNWIYLSQAFAQSIMKTDRKARSFSFERRAKSSEEKALSKEVAVT